MNAEMGTNFDCTGGLILTSPLCLKDVDTLDDWLYRGSCNVSYLPPGVASTTTTVATTTTTLANDGAACPLGSPSCVSKLCLGDFCCNAEVHSTRCSRCLRTTGDCAVCVPPYELNGTDCIPPPPVTTTTTTLGPSGAACSGSPNCVSGLCLGDYCCETSTLEHCSRCAADTGECAACVSPYEFNATSGRCVPAPPGPEPAPHSATATVVSISVVIVVAVLVLAAIYYWRFRPKPETPIDMVELLPSGDGVRADWWISWEHITLRERLGKGAFGTVYLAMWRQTEVALKMLHDAGDALNEGDTSEFEREAGTLSQIRHPSLVSYFGCGMAQLAGTADPRPFMVIELMAGGTLRDLLSDAAKGFEWPARVQCLQQIASGVAHLHGMSPPLVHRDLKAENVMCSTPNGAGGLVFKVGDFGTATAFEDSTKSRATLVKTLGVGSPLWMAPEVMSGKHGEAQYSYKVDVYSFSMVMYEVLTRELPFFDVPDASAFDLLNMVAAGDRPRVPHDCEPPDGYVALMESCWLAAPRERPDTELILTTLGGIDGSSPLGTRTLPDSSDTAEAASSTVDTWGSAV